MWGHTGRRFPKLPCKLFVFPTGQGCDCPAVLRFNPFENLFPHRFLYKKQGQGIAVSEIRFIVKRCVRRIIGKVAQTDLPHRLFSIAKAADLPKLFFRSEALERIKKKISAQQNRAEQESRHEFGCDSSYLL